MSSTQMAKGHFQKIAATDLSATAYELAGGVSATGQSTAGNGGSVPVRDRTGLNAFFVGLGANDAKATIRVYARKRVHTVNQGEGATSGPSLWQRQLVCTLVATLATGIAMPTTGSVFAASTYGVDTLTISVDAGWTHLVNTLGGGAATPAVYSPADNASLALFTIPDCFDAEHIDFDVDINADGGGTYMTGVNGCAETIR